MKPKAPAFTFVRRNINWMTAEGTEKKDVSLYENASGTTYKNGEKARSLVVRFGPTALAVLPEMDRCAMNLSADGWLYFEPDTTGAGYKLSSAQSKNHKSKYFKLTLNSLPEQVRAYLRLHFGEYSIQTQIVRGKKLCYIDLEENNKTEEEKE